MALTRRAFLGTACSAAASPLVTPVVFAAAPGENRLVVIILRGGLDGLGMVQPVGDRAFAGLRPSLARGGADLDGFFALAEPFAGLMPFCQAGELSFVHAVSTPYRHKRSHFDGQDMLENGSGDPAGLLTKARDGWLNRALALIPGTRAETAMAIGREHMMLLDGAAPAGSWSPSSELGLVADERQVLDLLYAGDPLFSDALAEAVRLNGDATRGREDAERLAAYAAKRLTDEVRIAAFSLGGWDTHRRQDRAIRPAADGLAKALAALKGGLGRHWETTAVVAMTEFGRTARENGSGGTDHGTGGAMLLAGGAVRGGRVFGDWPGLGEGALFEDRDLMPTGDVRRHAGWLLAGLYGLAGSEIARTVFPGVDLGSDPGLLA